MTIRSIITALLILCCIEVCATTEHSLPAIYVTTTDLNFRIGPGKSYNKVTTLPRGSEVKVTDLTHNNWARVEMNGNTEAYCYAKYLQYSGPVPSPQAEASSSPRKSH